MTAVDLNYVEAGSGAPLVIVHGLFGSLRNWGAIVKKLAETRRVITVDLRNHGDSPWADDVSYAALAADLVALFDRLDVPQVDLIGHSMGGKAVMTLALTHPDRVSRLLVSDIAPVSYPPAFHGFIDAMLGMDLSAIDRRSQADAALAEAVADRGIRAFLLQSLSIEKDEVRWKLNLKALKAGLGDISGWQDPAGWAPYEGPTLFTAGAKSDYIKTEDRGLIKERFPNVRIAKVKDAGHWIHAEQPAAFLAMVEAFLNP